MFTANAIIIAVEKGLSRQYQTAQDLRLHSKQANHNNSKKTIKRPGRRLKPIDGTRAGHIVSAIVCVYEYTTE